MTIVDVEAAALSQDMKIISVLVVRVKQSHPFRLVFGGKTWVDLFETQVTLEKEREKVGIIILVGKVLVVWTKPGFWGVKVETIFENIVPPTVIAWAEGNVTERGCPF